MLGPTILAASLVVRASNFKHGNRWQYHSRSDHHSKVACWVLMFDLVRHCALLREHAATGKVGYGLNHEMRDFRTSRKKNLDLVVCRPRAAVGAPAPTFADQALEIGIVLDTRARAELAALPRLDEAPVGAVHVALEAKACMTEFGKARPRLYDELNSSHECRNDGTPVELWTELPAPQSGDVDHYAMTVHRLAQLYEQKYKSV